MYNYKKRALIFGVENYKNQKLINPINDSKVIASSLKERGFTCIIKKNTGKETILNTLDLFSKNQENLEISLCYFAGHAIEFNGAGYILPSDVELPLSATNLEYYGISIATLIDNLPKQSQSRIIIIDACRDWPIDEINQNEIFLENLDKSRRKEDQWENVLISFSTSSGQKASDCSDLSNTHFSHSLSKKITQHGLSVEECLRLVNQEVIEKTKSSQRPWYYSSLNHRVSFSDLSDYKLLQSYNVTQEKSHPLSLSQPNHKDELLVTGVENQITKIEFYAGTSFFNPRDIIIDAIEYDETGIYLNSNGLLIYQESCKIISRVQSKIVNPHGFKLSKNHQKIIIYSHNGIEVFFKTQKKLMSVFYSQKIKSIYSVHFLNNSRAILGSNGGTIYVLNLNKYTFKRKKINGKHNHIYTVSSLNNDLLLSGSSGLLVTVNAKKFKIISDYSITKVPQSPLAIRSSLLHIADDKSIQRYIFDRKSLSKQQISDLEEQIPSIDILYYSVSPTLPIFAIGTSEGFIHIYDKRDMQLFQSIQIIDNSMNSIRGLQFTNNGMLAVLTKYGSLKFYNTQP